MRLTYRRIVLKREASLGGSLYCRTTGSFGIKLFLSKGIYKIQYANIFPLGDGLSHGLIGGVHLKLDSFTNPNLFGVHLIHADIRRWVSVVSPTDDTFL